MDNAEASARAAAPAAISSQTESISELARLLVGSVDLTQAQRLLRLAMHREALSQTKGSRRGAAKLLGVDRRYVQRLVSEH